MATHTGSEGTVRIGANSIAEIKSWTVEETGDTAEDTTMGDTWRTHKSTLKSWSGSLECFWDETDTNGQLLLITGNTVTLDIYPEGVASTDVYYTGDAIITGVSRTGAFDGLVEASFTFQGTGALTQTAVV